MTGEATIVFRTANPIPFTVDNATGIPKGSLLALTDLMTAAQTSVPPAENIAGIAATEKIASDGKTKLGVYTEGIFKMTASGAIPVGQAVQSGGRNNQVEAALVTTSGAGIIGYALETAADTETLLVKVQVGCGGNQRS